MDWGPLRLRPLDIVVYPRQIFSFSVFLFNQIVAVIPSAPGVQSATSLAVSANATLTSSVADVTSAPRGPTALDLVDAPVNKCPSNISS